MKMSQKYVFVVSSVNDRAEPVVTVFDNEAAARACAEFFRDQVDIICVDECPVYSQFLVYDHSEGEKSHE